MNFLSIFDDDRTEYDRTFQFSHGRGMFYGASGAKDVSGADQESCVYIVWLFFEDISWAWNRPGDCGRTSGDEAG